MSESGKSSDGVGACGLLGVAFVVLKLTGVINWSWWWVTCPFWGGLALVLGIIIVALPIVMLVKQYRLNRIKRVVNRSNARLDRPDGAKETT